MRTGALNQTASVNVRLKSLTAKESTDFRNKSDSFVEFQPGNASAEKLYLLLFKNCVVEEFHVPNDLIIFVVVCYSVSFKTCVASN